MLREMARFYPASVVISRLSAFFDFSQALLYVSSPPAHLIFCSVSRSLSLSPHLHSTFYSLCIFLSDTALSQIFSHNNPYSHCFGFYELSDKRATVQEKVGDPKISKFTRSLKWNELSVLGRSLSVHQLPPTWPDLPGKIQIGRFMLGKWLIKIPNVTCNINRNQMKMCFHASLSVKPFCCTELLCSFYIWEVLN